jgi:hypothetical protein
LISTEGLALESVGIPRVKEDHTMNLPAVLMELPLIKDLAKDNKKRQRTSDQRLVAFCLLFRQRLKHQLSSMSPKYPARSPSKTTPIP